LVITASSHEKVGWCRQREKNDWQEPIILLVGWSGQFFFFCCHLANLHNFLPLPAPPYPPTKNGRHNNRATCRVDPGSGLQLLSCPTDDDDESMALRAYSRIPPVGKKLDSLLALLLLLLIFSLLLANQAPRIGACCRSAGVYGGKRSEDACWCASDTTPRLCFGRSRLAASGALSTAPATTSSLPPQVPPTLTI